MAKGRPKSNPKLLEAEGAYRKHPERRPDESQLVSGEEGRPLPTLLVQADELTFEIWNETCDTLDTLGVLTKSDRFLIEAFCLNVRELYLLTKASQQNGHGQFGDDGTRKTCPNVVSYHKCMGTHIKLMGELALTPQSRLRMVAPEAKNESSDKVGSLLERLANG